MELLRASPLASFAAFVRAAALFAQPEMIGLLLQVALKTARLPKRDPETHVSLLAPRPSILDSLSTSRYPRWRYAMPESHISTLTHVAPRFDSTTITLRDGVAVMHARFEYSVDGADHRRTTRRGVATEIFIRQDGRWVNPFWYLQ